MNTDIVPSSAVLPTLISDDVKSLNVSAFAAQADRVGNGSCVTYVALLLPPLATPNRFVDCRRMGSPAFR